jgi:two-component system, OmpR family, response regulator ResD
MVLMQSEPTTQRILVIEDEPMVAEVVQRYLQRDGFSVFTAADGEAGLKMAESVTPDLVVLDLMLPKLSGFDVYQRLRAHSPVPVIVVTARGEETDRIVGLEMGADDYVAKPFSPRELAARVKAVLRRWHMPPPANGTLRAGDITVEVAERRAKVGDKDLSLTAKEFDLLTFFVRNPRQVFSRRQLLERVWDYDFLGDPSTVTVHIRRLRTKVEPEPMRPRYLKTVWGVGYKLEP